MFSSDKRRTWNELSYAIDIISFSLIDVTVNVLSHKTLYLTGVSEKPVN